MLLIIVGGCGATLIFAGAVLAFRTHKAARLRRANGLWIAAMMRRQVAGMDLDDIEEELVERWRLCQRYSFPAPSLANDVAEPLLLVEVVERFGAVEPGEYTVKSLVPTN